MDKKTKEAQGLVRKEATNLKKNATKTELRKLSFRKLDSSSRLLCVYGQMTTDCYSNRAVELIETCCERVYERSGGFNIYDSELNGKPGNRLEYWSPIEVFIDNPVNKLNGNNKRLIDFLKGKTKTLRFV